MDVAWHQLKLIENAYVATETIQTNKKLQFFWILFSSKIVINYNLH